MVCCARFHITKRYIKKEKIMRKRTILGLLLLSAIVCVSCNKGSEPGSETYAVMMTPRMQVKFISASGANIVDSLNFLESYKDRSYQTLTADDEIIKVSCVRETDGKMIWADQEHASDGTVRTLSFYRYGWARPIAGSSYEKEGTLLELGWADPVASLILGNGDDYPWKRPENYDESYTFNIQSPTIFGSDEVHTIKWYVHIIYNHYDAYRCEVDGVELDFKNLPYYSEWLSKAYIVDIDNYCYLISDDIIIPILVK